MWRGHLLDRRPPHPPGYRRQVLGLRTRHTLRLGLVEVSLTDFLRSGEAGVELEVQGVAYEQVQLSRGHTPVKALQ